MRLALISHHRIVEGEGVSAKLIRTAGCWRRLGHEVALLELPTGRIVELEHPGVATVEAPPRTRLGWIVRHQRWFSNATSVLRDLRPDAAFIRQGPWCPAFEGLLGRIPTIFEINSDPARELARRSRTAAAYWRWTWPRLAARAAGFNAVTSELLPRGVEIPSMVVANSVEVPATPPTREIPDGPPVVVMPIGSPSAWHGVDRVLRIAQQVPEAIFRLIGAPAETAPANVEFVPRMGEAALRDELSRCRIGLASLAMERAGLREACPLKSRTMIAAGLPIVYGYEDPDLAADTRFAIRIDFARDGLDAAVEAVRSLLETTRRDPGIHDEAWRFARDRLGVGVKEHRRLQFIADLIGDGGGRVP